MDIIKLLPPGRLQLTSDMFFYKGEDKVRLVGPGVDVYLVGSMRMTPITPDLWDFHPKYEVDTGDGGVVYFADSSWIDMEVTYKNGEGVLTSFTTEVVVVDVWSMLLALSWPEEE